MKVFWTIIIVAIIVVGGYFLLRSDAPEMGMVEDNAVVVSDQPAGPAVTVSEVSLTENGFVVVHEDADGTPGDIIGVSDMLAAGMNEDVSVSLSRLSEDGEMLYAMLHNDVDGDGVFTAETDTPVVVDDAPVTASLMVLPGEEAAQ